MHRKLQFANPPAMGCGPWLLRRLAWLACAGLLGLLGLALHQLQVPAPAAPGPAVVVQLPVNDQFAAMSQSHSACGGVQSHASCGEVDANDAGDQEILTGLSFTLVAVQSLQPAGSLDPADLVGEPPLLRPPRRQG